MPGLLLDLRFIESWGVAKFGKGRCTIMGNGRVVAVARVKAKKGVEAALRAELFSMREKAIHEKGCLEFAVHQGRDESSLFLSYEKWGSQEDLNLHLQMPYMKAFMEKAPEMLVGAPEISLWTD